MAISFEGQSAEYTIVLESTNYFFTAVFVLECVLKMIANGPGYFNPTWNKFDFFVVTASLFDIAMS